MSWFFDENTRSGLKRLAWGLQIRVILVTVGVPLWTWAVENRHPSQTWIEGVLWIANPLTDLMMASGGYRMTAKAGGAALMLAMAFDLYAGAIGLSGSELGRGQVPFAMGAAELLALLGTFSCLAWLRGPVEDVDHDYLERRIYRAMAHVAVSIACALLIRAVMWQGMFEGIAALIIAGSVVGLVFFSLTDVSGVLRLAADAEAHRVDDDAPYDDASGDEDDGGGRAPHRYGLGEMPAIPGYHHMHSEPREDTHD